MSSLLLGHVRATLMINFKKNLSKELVQNNKQHCVHGSMVCVHGYVQTTPDVTKNE